VVGYRSYSSAMKNNIRSKKMRPLKLMGITCLQAACSERRSVHWAYKQIDQNRDSLRPPLHRTKTVSEKQSRRSVRCRCTSPVGKARIWKKEPPLYNIFRHWDVKLLFLFFTIKPMFITRWGKIGKLGNLNFDKAWTAPDGSFCFKYTLAYFKRTLKKFTGTYRLIQILFG